MKKLICGFMILFLFIGFSAHASERGDLLIQVDLNDTPHPGCSILLVKQNGGMSIFVTGESIIAGTGLSGCDFDNTGWSLH